MSPTSSKFPALAPAAPVEQGVALDADEDVAARVALDVV